MQMTMEFALVKNANVNLKVFLKKNFGKQFLKEKINSTISHKRGANQIQKRLPVTTDNFLIMKSSLLITKPTYKYKGVYKYVKRNNK